MGGNVSYIITEQSVKTTADTGVGETQLYDHIAISGGKLNSTTSQHPLPEGMLCTSI